MPHLTIPSPLGPLALTEEDGALTRLTWGTGGTDETPLLTEAARQLAAYFARDLTAFDLPLAPAATPAQRRFLDALLAIPYGETRTYGDMARALGISPRPPDRPAAPIPSRS